MVVGLVIVGQRGLVHWLYYALRMNKLRTHRMPFRQVRAMPNSLNSLFLFLFSIQLHVSCLGDVLFCCCSADSITSVRLFHLCGLITLVGHAAVSMDFYLLLVIFVWLSVFCLVNSRLHWGGRLHISNWQSVVFTGYKVLSIEKEFIVGLAIRTHAADVITLVH